MKTRSRWVHLRRLFLLSVGFALGAMLCASAVAGPAIYRETATTRPHTAQNMPVKKQIKIYIMTSSSAIPRPISYIIGGVITTAMPIVIIGRGRELPRVSARS